MLYWKFQSHDIWMFLFNLCWGSHCLPEATTDLLVRGSPPAQRFSFALIWADTPKPSTSLPLPGVTWPASCLPSSPHLHFCPASCLITLTAHLQMQLSLFIFFVITTAAFGVSHQCSQVTVNVAAWLPICIPISAGNSKHFLSPSSFPLLPKHLYVVSYVMQKNIN